MFDGYVKLYYSYLWGASNLFIVCMKPTTIFLCEKKTQIIIHKSTALDTSVNSSLITFFMCSEKLADILCSCRL